MRRLATALLGALLLSGCAFPSSSSQSGIVATANTVSLDATKALTIATDAYTGVATLTTAAVKAGAFNQTQLQMINMLNDRAIGYIQGADKTLTAGQRAADLLLIVTQLHSILGK